MFAVTRGGAPEQFDGRVLRIPHGGSAWQVIATGRKLPSQLQPIPRGVVWSYEIPLGYVVEAFRPACRAIGGALAQRARRGRAVALGTGRLTAPRV